jgi:hypothetical protein
VDTGSRQENASNQESRARFDSIEAEKALEIDFVGGKMTFQRIVIGLLVLIVAALAAAFYIEWKTTVQLRTVKAFVEGHVFAEAVAACEKAASTTPFKWNGGIRTTVVGLNSVKLNKDTVIASYTLLADGVYCDYDPIKKKADIGSNFLERD